MACLEVGDQGNCFHMIEDSEAIEETKYFSIRGSGEMAPWLRAIAVPAKGLGLVPRIHMMVLNQHL